MHRLCRIRNHLQCFFLAGGVFLSSCNGATIATGCSRLAEPILSKATPHAVLGDSGNELLDYQLFAPAASAQLNKANDDKKTALTIIQRCEERDQAVIDRMNRRFFELF